MLKALQMTGSLNTVCTLHAAAQPEQYVKNSKQEKQVAFVLITSPTNILNVLESTFLTQHDACLVSLHLEMFPKGSLKGNSSSLDLCWPYTKLLFKQFHCCRQISTFILKS